MWRGLMQGASPPPKKTESTCDLYLKREILFITCTTWSMHGHNCDLTIFLNRKMPANKNNPLNRIGIFWYHFTPRKLPYLTVSVNFVKIGPHGLSGFFGPPCIEFACANYCICFLPPLNVILVLHVATLITTRISC